MVLFGKKKRSTFHSGRVLCQTRQRRRGFVLDRVRRRSEKLEHASNIPCLDAEKRQCQQPRRLPKTTHFVC